MEKQEEEKKRKIQGTRTTSTQIVPMDVTSEILSRLPAKSVVRFRCVSKLWSSVTIKPYFTKSFETRTRPSLLLFFKENNKLFVFSISQHNQNPNKSLTYSTSQPIETYHTIYPKSLSFTSKAQSVNGLISFQNSTIPMIWNPTMRKFLCLPEPDKNWKNMFLGYDPIEGKHKVLCFRNDECWILTLGLDREWRSINHNHHPFGNPQKKIIGRCIKGVLYYQAELAQSIVRVVMSFEVGAEKFHKIEIPPWGNEIAKMKMICYEGRLAYVDPSAVNSITIWVLEDAKKHKWSNRLFNLPHYKELHDIFTVIDFTDDGELIYVTKTVDKLLDVIFIDPKRETFRRVTYRGVVDDDFRKRNGLGDKSLRDVQFFTNHIETLVSL